MINRSVGDPLDNLANAIILLAVQDYRRALKRRKSEVRGECEKFFQSGWFEILTDVDGKVLMEKLQKEAGVR